LHKLTKLTDGIYNKLIHFSFIPLKKLSKDVLNSLDTRYELEEVISLNSSDELKLYIKMLGAKLTESPLTDLEGVDKSWVISGKLNVLKDNEMDDFYQQWLSKSGRENNMDEYCQVISLNSFFITLNKAKQKVVLQNT